MMVEKQPTPPTETDGSARLDLNHVTVSYHGKPALTDLTLHVQHGAQVAVVGPNGAGKSTLFKAIVGLLPLHAGHILIHGRPLGSHQDCVAYVPQREEVDWHFPVTVSDVVLMGRYGRLGWLRSPTRTDRELVTNYLKQLGIADLASRSIADLSGGQQQRVFLARALAQEPHILLMDEPFTGVDITTQEATLAMLDDLRRANVTVLVSTHDLNLAATRFESVLLLNHRLVAFGPAAEVFTGETVRQAFGSQVYEVGGTLVVDQCCGSHEAGHTHDSQEEPHS
jgi:ABC-type Mn2+/Zn2+ transport system ATPase subunit